MADVIEHDVATGERIEREFTPDEAAAKAEQEQAAAQLAAMQQAKEMADKATRDAAIAHAKSLGFTDQMIAVMYPNLVEA